MTPRRTSFVIRGARAGDLLVILQDGTPAAFYRYEPGLATTPLPKGRRTVNLRGLRAGDMLTILSDGTPRALHREGEAWTQQPSRWSKDHWAFEAPAVISEREAHLALLRGGAVTPGRPTFERYPLAWQPGLGWDVVGPAEPVAEEAVIQAISTGLLPGMAPRARAGRSPKPPVLTPRSRPVREMAQALAETAQHTAQGWMWDLHAALSRLSGHARDFFAQHLQKNPPNQPMSDDRRMRTSAGIPRRYQAAKRWLLHELGMDPGPSGGEGRGRQARRGKKRQRLISTSALAAKWGMSVEALYRICTKLGLERIHQQKEGVAEWYYPLGEAQRRYKAYQAAARGGKARTRKS